MQISGLYIDIFKTVIIGKVEHFFLMSQGYLHSYMTTASQNTIWDAEVYRKITCCSHPQFVLEPEHSPEELCVTNAVICFFFSFQKGRNPFSPGKKKML